MKGPLYSVMVCLSVVSFVIGNSLRGCPASYLLDPAVTRFRRYIQIDTSREDNLHRAVDFMRHQAQELGVPFNVFTPGGLPVVVISVVGSDPSLPTIMLNSHMDVVPAVENEWTYPPYSAYIDEKGDIYGRGTQDTKDVGMQYIEVIRRFKENNVVLKRTIHITIMPDEEVGGEKGIMQFINTDAFKAMNVGFALDEGIPSQDNHTLFATFQDRRPWQIRVRVHGEAGHGYSMPDSAAMEKAIKFTNIVKEYRDQQRALLRTTDPNDFGKTTSLNMNIFSGGYRVNVIPSFFDMVVDIRLSTDASVTDMERLIKSWVLAAGNGTELTFIRRIDVSKKSRLDDTNPYWVTMRNAVNNMGYKLLPVVCPATTDMIPLRNIGIPAVGFSAKLLTEGRAHGTDEYVNAETYIRGIDLYYEVIKELGNLVFNEKPVKK